MNPVDKKRRPRASKRPKPILIEETPAGGRANLSIPLHENGLGQNVEVPFIVMRGAAPGPTVGISAAVHGNELNGIKIIHNLLARLDPAFLAGSLLCAPIVNVPAFNAGIRRFSDGRDLNHTFPGKAEGRPSEQYARAFEGTFLPACDYLIDIHTASEGRINTMYVRADLHNDKAADMARHMNPQIVLHARGGDATLRGAARRRGIPGITVEAGNPSVFQGRMVFEGEAGILNVLTALGLLPGQPLQQRRPVICKSSKWIRTTGGGILETRFSLFDRIARKQLLAETRDPFGELRKSYLAPHEGIVIGMAAHPVSVPGTRFCHLGVVGEPDGMAGKVDPNALTPPEGTPLAPLDGDGDPDDKA